MDLRQDVAQETDYDKSFHDVGIQCDPGLQNIDCIAICQRGSAAKRSADWQDEAVMDSLPTHAAHDTDDCTSAKTVQHIYAIQPVDNAAIMTSLAWTESSSATMTSLYRHNTTIQNSHI